MTVITVMLYALVTVVALLLIGLILIQPSKGGGFGSSFGGVGESVFGAKVGSHLTKLTVVMSSIFFIATLMLAAVVSYSSTTGESDLIGEKLATKNSAVDGSAVPAIAEEGNVTENVSAPAAE